MKTSHYLIFCAYLCIFFFSPDKLLAFDSGHHADVSRSALIDEGFAGDGNAANVVILQNWLVDYYSNRINILAPDLEAIKVELVHLHFDNLTTREQVINYWAGLTNNTRAAVQQTAREIAAAKSPEEKNGKLLKMLTLIGASSHAVQDFYTHSNWIDIFPKNNSSYRSNTWFDTPQTSIPATVRTGAFPNNDPILPTDHGDYFKGMNNDSYFRPRFSEAYVFAYSASRQWIRAIKTWTNEVNPAIWKDVLSFSVSSEDSDALDKDLTAMYRISEWVVGGGKSGVWKGAGSGSPIDFGPFIIDWTTDADSIYVGQFKQARTYKALITGLANPNEKKTLSSSPAKFIMDRRTVEVRTLAVDALNDPDPFGFFTGGADFYAVIEINGQAFIESMQLDNNHIKPYWLSINFVPVNAKNIAIAYQLFDEDGNLLGDDDEIDVNPAADKTHLKFNFDPSTLKLNGEIIGVHSTTAGAVESSGVGNNDRAKIKFFVSSLPCL
jgi:hypothetical protein